MKAPFLQAKKQGQAALLAYSRSQLQEQTVKGFQTKGKVWPLRGCGNVCTCTACSASKLSLACNLCCCMTCFYCRPRRRTGLSAWNAAPR